MKTRISAPAHPSATGGRVSGLVNGPLGRSLHSFPRITHSTDSVHGLEHSLRSLLRGTVEIHEYVFTLKTRLTGGKNGFVVVTRNTPSVCYPLA